MNDGMLFTVPVAHPGSQAGRASTLKRNQVSPARLLLQEAILFRPSKARFLNMGTRSAQREGEKNGDY
jgi:hypothetical protein